MRGGAATGAAQLADVAIRVTSLVVLARLLTPADFGLVAMVTAVTALLELVWQLGLPQATVQRAALRESELSTLFWINAAASLVGALGLFALAPALAWFYDQPRLAGIAALLALGPFLEGLGLQHLALLRRRMEFGLLSGLQIVASLLGALTAIALAALGAGAWSLVGQILVRGVAQSAGAWRLSGWRPGRPSREGPLQPLLGFGLRLTGAGVLQRLSETVGDVLIGRFVGETALGLFTRAESLLTLPKGAFNAPMAGVAIPGLSRLQGEPERFRRYYCKAVLPPVLVGMPLVAFLFVAADDVVRLFLGPQWDEAVPVFRWLAPSAFIGTFNMATSWVFLACGLADRQLRWTMISVGVRIVAMAIGIGWGLHGVAAAWSVSALLTRVPSIVYGFRGTPLVPSDLWGVLWRPALASWVAAAALAGVESARPLPASAPLALLVGVALFAPAYLSCWVALPGGPRILRDNLALLRHILPRP